MNVVAAVANLQKELDWYKVSFREAQDIIKQMSGQPPRGFQYINPFDFAEMLESIGVEKSVNVVSLSNNVFEMPDGQRYKQSPLIPAKVNKFK